MGFLELDQVQKRFNQFVAVENFMLKAEKGEFISFLGPSGCGKTTTLRMVAGFEQPTSGSIKIDGKEITNLPPNQRNIGMVFQSYALFPNMTVAQNIGFGLKVAGVSKETREKRVAEMLDLIHMANFAQRYPYQLSGGQQQRVALARALAIQPQLLLLDEPLSALDAKIRLELRSEIRAVQQKLGITTIYVTHDQEEALSLSDRVVVMKDGRIEQIGAPAEIYTAPQTRFVASFIGTLNLLKVDVDPDDRQLVTVDGQKLVLPVPSSKPGQIILSLRPEIFSLQAQHDTDNVLTCQVLQTTFLGPVVRMKVSLGSQSMLVDVVNAYRVSVPEAGQKLTLYFPRQGCLVLEED
jgi:putative spermidine/putrescine transport system ATP-binding protein